MPDSYFSSLSNLFPTSAVQSMASHFGASERTVLSGIQSSIAAIVSGLAQKSNDKGFIGQVVQLATSTPENAATSALAHDALTNPNSSSLSGPNQLLFGVLGGKLGPITEALRYLPNPSPPDLGKNEVIRLAEEHLEVGKRLVEEGTTRIRRFVTETPVEKQVTLHEEHADVVRRAVSDPDFVKDIDWYDQTIEVLETSEEAVVSKMARVAEEVVGGKTGFDRVETVHDTVRRQQVEVERVPGKNHQRPGRSFVDGPPGRDQPLTGLIQSRILVLAVGLKSREAQLFARGSWVSTLVRAWTGCYQAPSPEPAESSWSRRCR